VRYSFDGRGACAPLVARLVIVNRRGIAHVKKILLTMAVLAVTAAGGAALVDTALADAPKTLKVVKTVNIQAPVDKVWNTVKDFDSLNKWHPGFAKDEIVKGDDNKPGTVRKLTIKDGPSFTEELLAFDEATHSYRYRIIESPLPVRNYVSHISVKPDGKGGSKVTWSGTFKRKSTSDTPPEAENDDAAIKLITGVYEAGLANLKKMLGG
jgi:mxaD protein